MFEKIIKRGLLMTVAVLILCVLGIVATFRIPIQMIPDLDVRTITVITNWPGATPQDVEKEIIIEQEEFLRNLPSLSRINASAGSNQARVELEFPFGVDLTEMLIRVNNALSQVTSYPENVDEPRIFASAFSSNSFMFFRASPLPGNPRQLDMDLMKDFLKDNVRPRMASVTGVADIGVWGGAERQIQIAIDPARLSQRGLTLNEVRQAIRNRNQDRSAGDIESGKRRYLIRTVGRFETLEELEQLILRRDNDAVIRLRDVATVALDHSEKTGYSWIDNNPTIFMVVEREAGSNVIEIKRDMLLEVEAINRDVMNPAGMEVVLFADDATYVEQSIRNVWQNLILGALFATAVMFLFLQSVRTTLIGVIGIPACTIAAFLGLLIAERTINVISLAGIAFAIGMTLDNSIVVLESIKLEMSKGLDKFKAAVKGVQQVWPAVLASTLTTVMVFLPVAFVEQEAGQLYSDIAIAISASILASMLVAITVVPTAIANLGQKTDQGSSNSRFNLNTLGRRWSKVTVDTVAWLLATSQRRITCIVATLVTSLAIMFGLTPDAEYLPEGEEPKIFATMSAPPGYNIDAMVSIADELRDYFVQFVNDDPKAFARGETEVPAMKYVNMRAESERIRIIAEPLDIKDTDVLMQALTDKYREYPGMRAFAARGSIITSNDGGTRSINLDISGPRLEAIYEVALQVYRRAESVFGNPRIQTKPSSLTLAQPMIEIQPKWDTAAELGMTNSELGFTVAALTNGSYIDEFFLADDKIDIYLYSNAGQNASLDQLPQLPIYTPNGTILPLSSIANVVETVDTSRLRRVDGKRTVTLNIIPPDDIALETGVNIVREEVIRYLEQAGAIPTDVQIGISGAADQLDATRDALMANYAVALVIIYLLLVAIFSHWGYPLLIMTSIPLGVAGGIVGLALLNVVGAILPYLGLQAISQPFDMISMLGFLILMGTVVNNPILIVHRSVENYKKLDMSAVEAVQEAVGARLRPIAMSTITTICGLAPLVLIPGAGTELYRGVGAIVMFGILGSAFVTLTLLPTLTVEILRRTSNKDLAENSAPA